MGVNAIKMPPTASFLLNPVLFGGPALLASRPQSTCWSIDSYTPESRPVLAIKLRLEVICANLQFHNRMGSRDGSEICRSTGSFYKVIV